MNHTKCATRVEIGLRILVAQTGFLCFCILLSFLILCPEVCGQQNSKERRAEGTRRAWHDGKRWCYVLMSKDEIAVFHVPSLSD